MADAMDQYAVRRTRQGSETHVTRFTVRAAELHLDELVVMQCAFGLGDDRGGDSGIADEQHGFQCVPQTPKILALTF